MKTKEINDYPVIGATYKHYKGGSYTVITLATDVDTDKSIVIYKSIEFGTIWARSLEDWNSKVYADQDGISYKNWQQRFTKIT